MKKSSGRQNAKGQPLRRPFEASTAIVSTSPQPPNFGYEDTEADDDRYSVTSTIANFDFEEEMEFAGVSLI